MDTAADPTKTATTHPHPGHEGHGVHLCSRCGWAFPSPHPSARHRRRHRRVCGTVGGYTTVSDSTSASLGHSHSQHSAISSFSDDENQFDGDSKASNAKAVIGTSASRGGSGRVLERMNMSADDVFADAVSEFADASLVCDDGLSVNTKTVSNMSFGAPDFAPSVEDVAVTGGIAQASIRHGNSNGSPQEGTTASLNQEQTMSFFEVPANIDDAMADACEEIKRSNASEDPDGFEAGFKMVYDASEVNPAPFIVPESKDANQSSEAVPEKERTSKDHAVAETEISQNEEKHDVKLGSETFMDVHFQGGETIVRSSDEFSGFKVEHISQIKFDELSIELAAEGSASAFPVISEIVDVPSITESNNVVLVNNQAVESISEIEEDISYSLSVDDTGALHSAAEIETLETSLGHAGSGHVSDVSNEKYVNSLARASANDDTRALSTNGQEGSIVGNINSIDPDGGYEGIVVEDFVAKGEGNVSENETNSDNLPLNISSEEPVSKSPVVFAQSAGTTSQSESVHADRAVQLSSDVNSPLADKFIDNTTAFIKEVKLDDAHASVPASDMKPVSHDVLLQKLVEHCPDDEAFPATESSSRSIGNNQVDDGGVICKDSCANDIGQSQGPEKAMAIPVVDAPNEISSPNGSSLDGNWGSVSVLSTMSDAAGDAKKTKEGQSDDKQDMFDPPSFLTLIDPQAQKGTATSSTSGEVQNPQQPDAAKAAWFRSITNVPNDSHGRMKNEEIIAKVTNWSTTGKQHSPLKTLLGEAKANSPNSNPSSAIPKDEIAESCTPIATVNSILGSEEPDQPKDKIDPSAKEGSPTARHQDEIKGKERKVKGRPYWMPFVCCSSVSSVK